MVPEPTRVNMCIHMPEIDGNPLSATQMQTLLTLGLVDVRLYGDEDKSEKGMKTRYLLARFDLATVKKAEDINIVLANFGPPVFCFVETCPRETLACPAFRP